MRQKRTFPTPQPAGRYAISKGELAGPANIPVIGIHRSRRRNLTLFIGQNWDSHYWKRCALTAG